MHQAFYRKYRPQTFDDVYGQEHITSVLRYQTSEKSVSHAYLFCGSRGTGKTTCAKILAKAVNCENPVNGNPCGKCPACVAIDTGAATDVVEMDAASNNGVDNIRELRDEVTYTPSMLKKRVYIIDEVHMLSTSAFNALLKTLEEPPEYVVFILATTEIHKLPATIISRCQRFDFRRITVDNIVARLKYIADAEKIALTDEAAARIARIAEGGMRDAVSLFELCSGGGVNVDSDRVNEVLGLSDYETMRKAAVAASSTDASTLIGLIAEAQASSKDIAVLWNEFISFWRDMMIMKISKEPTKYLDLTEAESSILTDCASRFPMGKLLYQSQILDNAQRDMTRSPQNKRTIAEFAVLRLTVPSLDTSTDALLARIAELEDRVTLLESGITPSQFTPKTETTPVPTETKQETVPEAQDDPVEEEPAVRDDPVTESDPFIPVRDVHELADKMGSGSEMYRTCITESVIEITEDSSRLRVTVPNAFYKTMLDNENAKMSLAKAAVLAKLASTVPTVEITVASDQQNKSDNDLFMF